MLAHYSDLALCATTVVAVTGQPQQVFAEQALKTEKNKVTGITSKTAHRKQIKDVNLTHLC